jgi:2,3-bisphosphoglycerate-independent phosphoglycerate mutase
MVRRDGLDHFDEVSAVTGSLGQLTGRDLMPLVLYLSRRAPFYTS